jgi:hypothetical membrane protein
MNTYVLFNVDYKYLYYKIPNLHYNTYIIKLSIFIIMSSTLLSFIFSLGAGVLVLSGISVALIWVSSNDPLTRA